MGKGSLGQGIRGLNPFPKERITQLVDQKCPPSRVLVSCIHSVRDSLRRFRWEIFDGSGRRVGLFGVV